MWNVHPHRYGASQAIWFILIKSMGLQPWILIISVADFRDGQRWGWPKDKNEHCSNLKSSIQLLQTHQFRRLSYMFTHLHKRLAHVSSGVLTAPVRTLFPVATPRWWLLSDSHPARSEPRPWSWDLQKLPDDAKPLELATKRLWRCIYGTRLHHIVNYTYLIIHVHRNIFIYIYILQIYIYIYIYIKYIYIKYIYISNIYN